MLGVHLGGSEEELGGKQGLQRPWWCRPSRLCTPNGNDRHRNSGGVHGDNRVAAVVGGPALASAGGGTEASK